MSLGYLFGHLVHRHHLVDHDLKSISQSPLTGIEHPDVHQILLRVKVFREGNLLDGNHTLLDQLLLSHGFLPVDFGHLLRKALSDASSAGV